MYYQKRYTGHERIDQRLIAYHRAIAAKLTEDPSLLRKAHAFLDRHEPSANHAMPYFKAWRELLSLPIDQLFPLLTEDSERMRALRQNTPFVGILTNHERWSILKQYSIKGSLTT
jgi:hypothetical protein